MTNIISFIKPAINLLKILGPLISRFRSVRDFPHEGLYLGYRNGQNDLVEFELVRVSRSALSISARPVYVHSRRNSYSMNCTPTRYYRSILSGSWRSDIDRANLGNLLLRVLDGEEASEYQNYLVGCWTGSHSDGSVDFGPWILARIDAPELERLEPYIDPSWLGQAWLRMQYEWHRLRGKIDTNLLDDIIRKHEECDDTAFTCNSRSYSVEKYVFNPKLGKVSGPLLSHALKLASLGRPQTILDWGSGTGYYACELALLLREQVPDLVVVALESDKDAHLCAKDNIYSHNVENIVSLYNVDCVWKAKNDCPFEFDLIVANLPFTRGFLGRKHRSHRMYPCFVATYRGIMECIATVAIRLSAQGTAVVSFGKSGNLEFLHSCLSAFGLEYKRARIETDGRGDDEFYIYEISHKYAGRYRSLRMKVRDLLSR